MQDDAHLGRQLVQAGKLSEGDLQEALSRQKSLIMEGRAARLGEMLVKSGKVTPGDIQAALAKQSKSIGQCEKCGARFNVLAWVPNRIYRCGKCQEGALKPVPETQEVSVSGSNVMAAINAAEPVAAMTDTQRKAAKRLGGMLLVKELGRGGMGIVYQGLQEQLRRTVAVKILLGSDDEKLKARFLREARVVSKLRHPNIVAVHELGEDDGKAFFTMDFIEGGPLNALFAPHRLPARELMEIVAKMARALDYAHRSGLVHRDVKPQNILVASDGTPFLSDFGLAREVESGTRLTMSGAVMGTPSYMSPEQARGEGGLVDGRSDIYSLGAVLYEGLTGRPPFDGKDLISLLEAIIREDPLPPSQVVRGVNSDVETICLKALDKQPAKRYQTGEEMAADIDRWLSGEGILAKRSGALEKGAKWLQRRAAMVFAAAAMLGIASIAGVVIWRGKVAERENLKRVAENNEAELKREKDKREQDRLALAEQSKLERERHEREMAALLEQIGNAKTAEEKAALEAKLAGLKGTETIGTTPDGSKDPAWAARVRVLEALKIADNLAGARVTLAEWEPVSEEEKAAKAEWEAALRRGVAEKLARVRETAAKHESAGTLDAALASWKTVAKWEDPSASMEAAQEISRLDKAIATRASAQLAEKELPALRDAVAAGLAARDFDGALALLTTKEAAFPDLRGPIADLKWIVRRGQDFWKTLDGALVAGVDLDVPKFSDTGRSTGASKGSKVQVKLVKTPAEISVDLNTDVSTDQIVKIVRAAGGDEDSIALFLFFRDTKKDNSAKEVERAEKEQKANRGRAVDMAAKSESQEILAAFFSAMTKEPKVTPPIDTQPPVTPVDATAWAVAPVADAHGGWTWSYGLNNPEQFGDWLVAPRNQGAGRDPWGAHLEDGKGVWMRSAMMGWTGSNMEVLAITAHGTMVEGEAGRIGVSLGGYMGYVEGGTQAALVSGTGKFCVSHFPLKRSIIGREITYELTISLGTIPQIVFRVDGEVVWTGTMEDGWRGPTGVFVDGDAAASWDWVNVNSNLDANYETHLKNYRAFLASSVAAASPAKTLSDGGSLGAFKTNGGWVASGGVVRGHSGNVGQEAGMGQPVARNFRARFKYQAGARMAAVDPRAGNGRAIFLLPMENVGRWRTVELIAAERCLQCTVDGGLRIYLKDPPADSVGPGDLAFLVMGGDVQVDDIVIEEIPGLESGSGPATPFQPPAPGNDNMGPPGGDGRWTDLFDGNGLEAFVRKDKYQVKNGELIVPGELETVGSFNVGEFEVEVQCDKEVKMTVNVRGVNVAKFDLSKGKHMINVRVDKDVIDVRVDGKQMKANPGGSDAGDTGPFKFKVDGGAVRVLRMRHRPPGPMGPPMDPPDKGPGPDKGPDRPPK